ncbi:NAD(P)H-binding protein [Actinomycetospora chibensis]|uniref:NAD(P)H-binding protein n=1 Tax=Actinomycetospora chibensis TaxID=663606 RepID=A0ABV9RCH3_9PSEU|nr:NAD(P)H-binding protein [Actinomycetospora chibensis]MDD7927289.1 NAD(P)H-binding protein [Actinomycetospora chibensis]
MSAIVVTGATGTVGRHVVVSLLEAGASVRALARHPPAGDEPDLLRRTRFSYTDPDTWTDAFAGAEALFVVRPPEVVDVARDLLPALDAARASGIRRVVFLSVLGAERNPLLPHRRVERWLETSGMASTSLRAANFMQNLAGVHAADIRDRDQLVVPAGDAAMSYVDARDVAEVAARCLLALAPTRGAWDVTGPEAITHHQVASALSHALARPIRYTRPSLARYWAHAHRTGMPAGLIAATSVLYTLARAGIGARVSDDVEELLGRPARDILRFAQDHRSTWTSTPSP